MPLLDPVVRLATLPARLAVAATRTTLALGELVDPQGPVRRHNGYADRLMLVIGEGGLLERLAASLSDPGGPIRLVNVVSEVLDPDRPLGRALAAGGTIDRLLAEGGALDQLAADGGPLDRLLEAGGALDRVTRPGGVLDRLLVEEGLLDRLLTEDGFVEKLVAEGGTLEQLVALGATLERIQPRLAELVQVVPELHASVDALNRAVEPLSGLATRIPGGRRRAALDA
jgi:hypothetical protein